MNWKLATEIYAEEILFTDWHKGIEKIYFHLFLFEKLKFQRSIKSCIEKTKNHYRATRGCRITSVAPPRPRFLTIEISLSVISNPPSVRDPLLRSQPAITSRVHEEASA